MVKFTRMLMSVSIDPLLNLDKILAYKPTRTMILSNSSSRFKNSFYIASNKQRKNWASIIREAHLPNDVSYRGKIMTIMEPNKAVNSNESFIISCEKNCRHFISSMIHCLSFLVIQGVNFQNHALAILVIIASTAVIMELLKIPRVVNLFKGTKEGVKDKPQEINKAKKTLVAPNLNLWRLTSEDLLVTIDAYKIEYFVYNMCMLIVWWLLFRLVSFMRRFYSKNDRK